MKYPADMRFGQARKSLWIETTVAGYFVKPIFGQARKSLWIETLPQHDA